MARSITYPLAAVTIWGGMFAVLAGALHHVDAVNLTAVRYGTAVLFMIALLAAREGWAALRPGRRAGEILVLGAVGFAGFNLLTNLALGRTAPQNAALVVALAPMLTVLVRWARDRVRPAPVTLLLVAAALVGVLLVISKGRPTAFGSFGVGDLMMLGAVTGWAVYTHGATRFGEFSPLRYATLTAVAGTLVILAVTLVTDLAGWSRLPSVADLAAVWPHLVYVVVLGSIVSILAWNVGIRRLGAPNAALFMNLVPVTALVVATVGGYRPRPVELAGVALTAAAIVTANLVGRRAGRGTPAPSAGRRERQPVPVAVSASR